MRILHLSDPHYGFIRDEAGVQTKLGHFFETKGKPNPDGLLDVLKRDGHLSRAPDIVVISGDVGWSGHKEDYQPATKFVLSLKSHWPNAVLLIVAGNHDVNRRKKNQRQTEFEKFLTAVGCAHPALIDASELKPREKLMFCHRFQVGNAHCVAVGVNSAAHLDDKGTPVWIRPDVLKAAEKKLSQLGGLDSDLRLFVIHHHLLPFVDPNWKNTTSPSEFDQPDETIVRNSAKLQTWLVEHNFHLVLHGHKHQAHGRLDRLWTSEMQGRHIAIIGAGSAGVERGHFAPESLGYNIVTAAQQSRDSWHLDVSVRRVTEKKVYEKAVAEYAYDMVVGPEPVDQPVVVQSERADWCHAVIKRRTERAGLIRNFVSIIDQGAYYHPTTSVFQGQPVDADQVIQSFKTLHPEYARSERWRNLSNIDDLLHELSPAFQFQHGPRLLAAHGDERKRPLTAALETLLGPSKAHAYASVYDRRIDLDSSRGGPVPALVGVQFVPVGADKLDVVMYFRKIELSFWWTVNVYEATQLLEWACEKQAAGRTPGRITFLAGLAEWKTANVDAAFTTRLDEMSLHERVEVIRRAVNGDSEAARELAQLLTEKRKNTHAQNLDATGIGQLASILRGMGVEGELADVLLALEQACDAIKLSISGQDVENMTHVTRVHEALQKAETLLAAIASSSTSSG